MLKLNEQTMDEMSDEELVKAIADCPYLVDIYAYDTMKEGLLQFQETCDAYRELMGRENGKKSFITYSQVLIDEMNERPREDDRTEFVSLALSDIARQLEREKDNGVVCLATTSGVKTPKGSSVSCLTPTETHSATYHATLDNEIVSTYGVTLVRNGSCKYNCGSIPKFV